MKKLIAAAALIAFMGCGEKKADSETVGAPDAAVAPAAAPTSTDSMPMPADSSMARDTSTAH